MKKPLKRGRKQKKCKGVWTVAVVVVSIAAIPRACTRKASAARAPLIQILEFFLYSILPSVYEWRGIKICQKRVKNGGDLARSGEPRPRLPAPRECLEMTEFPMID